MKKFIYITIGIALIAIVIIRLKLNKDSALENVYRFDANEPIAVRTDTIHIHPLEDAVRFTGMFEPFRETKISAELQGKITEMHVDAGSEVSKGQILVQLDNSLLKLQLQAAQIQVESFEADVKRYTVLAEADAIQRIQLEKAETGLKSARVQQATLEEQINKTSIRAPFDGVITAKFSETGAFAAPGVPILQLTDISKLKFTINIPEKELRQFTSDKSFSVSADAYPELMLHGKISMTGSKTNPANQFPVQFTVENTTDLKIKSGMFGHVKVRSEKDVMSITIPGAAVSGSPSQPEVFVVKNGMAVTTGITVSGKYGDRVAVSDGLKEGDIIVTDGFQNLHDSAKVVVH